MSFFNDVVRDEKGKTIPTVAVVTYWPLNEESYRDNAEQCTYVVQGLYGGTGPDDDRNVEQFMNDWADDYKKEHAFDGWYGLNVHYNSETNVYARTHSFTYIKKAEIVHVDIEIRFTILYR